MSAEQLRSIRAQSLAVLARVIGRGTPVALLDYPFHPNAGDVLIWAGTRAYLAELGAEVHYHERHDRYSPEELRAHHPSGPILLHGGGNFGDRWPVHQAFRERVIADFPDRHIVQLPQTIEMSAATAVRIQAAYARHPRLTVLLRDSGSLRAAESLLPDLDVAFCPDLAFGYSPRVSHRPAVDVLEVKRHDSESSTSDPLFVRSAGVSVSVADWGLTRPEEFRWRLIRGPGDVGRRLAARIPAAARLDVPPRYDDFTRIILRSAQRRLASGRVVVTDRLHAVVLAALMEIPVVARDNANHKISTIIGDYLGGFPNVAFAADQGEATQLVQSLLPARAG